MHGFGARILHALPREPPGLSSRALHEALQREAMRAPSLYTVRRHLAQLLRMHLVLVDHVGAERRYSRLVDSVLDVEVPA